MKRCRLGNQIVGLGVCHVDFNTHYSAWKRISQVRRYVSTLCALSIACIGDNLNASLIPVSELLHKVNSMLPSTRRAHRATVVETTDPRVENVRYVAPYALGRQGLSNLGWRD